MTQNRTERLDRENPDCGCCGGPFYPRHWPGGGGSPGYGVRPDGTRICYECCADDDRKQMIEGDGRITLYLVETTKVDRMACGLDKPKVWEITNWPGTLRLRCYGPPKSFHHPFARHAVMAYFRGPDGKTWSAKNVGDNQIAHCRRLKAA